MKTALIVIDYINDIVHKDGKIPSCAEYVETNGIIKNLNCALENAREKGYLVIHVRVTFDKKYTAAGNVSPVFTKAREKNALEEGRWGTMFHEDVKVLQEEIIVSKHRISAFYNTDLEVYLRANRIERILIAGVSTNMAVELTVREAHDRDYFVEIIEDACASYNKEMHAFSIKVLSNIAKITDSGKI
ncbi:MAG TPA: cysteine hydrolase [Lentisphaeria bacterium]|nr:MAG: hypothetical protein A2X47_04455 [Lentisphaerae bacterium GWF2_38_69]HBM16242.1 cysteine hydrolase [Lentisphaeria bacterium]